MFLERRFGFEMIRNKRKFNEFYGKLIEQESISHEEALLIYEVT